MPAAAVIRRVQALSGMTGRKEMRRRLFKQIVKSGGSTIPLLSELGNLSMVGVAGIAGVGVKSVDISRNTNGEGRRLDHY